MEDQETLHQLLQQIDECDRLIHWFQQTREAEQKEHQQLSNEVEQLGKIVRQGFAQLADVQMKKRKAWFLPKT